VDVVVGEHNLLDCMGELENLLGGPKWVSGTYFRLEEEETDCFRDKKSRLKHVEEKVSSYHDTRLHSNYLALALLHSLGTC